jgi:hypothetical protein
MTQHNTDDEHHPLKPFWNPKDHIEEIVNLPEFEKLHEFFRMNQHHSLATNQD